MKPPANPVSPDDVAAFAGYVQKWQALLNLGDWRIIHSDKPAKNACADVSISVSDHTSVIRLGAHFGEEPVTPHSLESTAAHELLHILLSAHASIIESKCSDEVRMAAEHRIVHTLERLLVPKA